MVGHFGQQNNQGGLNGTVTVPLIKPLDASAVAEIKM